MDDDIIDGFVAPSNPPQLETEANAPLADLIMVAPKWDAAFSIELVVLARRHQVIRSLLGFPLELALQSQNSLLTEDDEKEIFRHQGAARALVRCNQVIFEGLMAAEEHLNRKIAQDQEEEDDQTQPQYVP